MKKHRIFLIWIGAVLGVVALGFGGYAWLGQKQVTPRDKITIAIPGEPLNALLIIARELDLFSREGLEVMVKDEYSSGTGARALEGLLAGKVDVATSVAETAVVFKSFERQDFSIIASNGSSDNDAKIVARKDRGITKSSDLRGKRIGTPKGTSMDFFLHVLLVKNGIAEKDVAIRYGKLEELPVALAQGEIDALSVREPYVSQAMKLSGGSALVLAEPGLYVKTLNVVALNSFVKEKPDTVKKLLRALLRAEEFARKETHQALKIVSNRLKLGESEMTALRPDLDLRVSLDQRLLLSLEDEARWAIKNKLTQATQVPNYLNFIYLDGLKAVKPERIRIIH